MWATMAILRHSFSPQTTSLAIGGTLESKFKFSASEPRSTVILSKTLSKVSIIRYFNPQNLMREQMTFAWSSSVQSLPTLLTRTSGTATTSQTLSLRRSLKPEALNQIKLDYLESSAVSRSMSSLSQPDQAMRLMSRTLPTSDSAG